MRRNAFVTGIALAVILLLTPTSSLGQGTTYGTIRGTVTDAQGGMVAGAKVRMTDLETNQERELATDSTGNYEAGNLKPGGYKVNISFSGFKAVEVLNVTVRGSEITRADAKLEPSAVTETITVTTEAPVIQTETPTLAATLTTQAILDLPRDSRDILDFLYMNPNITPSADGGGYKFLGAQSYGATFTLDGQRSNGGVFGEPTGSQPSLETIGELTVLSSNFTAEYPGIANIRISTKRGGSDYHGSAFYNNKNSALAAWTISDKVAKANFTPTFAVPSFPTPFFNLNEVGGSFAGPLPVSRQRTFFLTSYEHRWNAYPARFRSTRVPAPALLAGDFSKITDSRKPVVPPGVTLTPEEMAANTITVSGTPRLVTIPRRLMNPVVGKLIAGYFPNVSPAAPYNTTNGRLLDFYQNQPNLEQRDLATLRIDHDFSGQDKIYGVYNVQRFDGGFKISGTDTNPAVGMGDRQRRNHTVSLSWTHVFSSNLINEARGGFNRQNDYRTSRNTLGQFLTNIGFDQSDVNAYASIVGASQLDRHGQPAINFGSLWTAFPDGGRNVDRPLNQSLATFGDTLSWVRRKHSIRAGYDLVRSRAVDGFSKMRGRTRGLITYSGSDINPMVRFLMGLPPNSVSYVPVARDSMDVMNREHGMFVQDDFRIHPRLTLYLGLRYELITPFVEAHDMLANFDPNTNSAAGNKGRFIVPSSTIANSVDPRMLTYGLVLAKQAGLGRALVNTDKNNIAPRLGLAYRLNTRTVLRGGYGFFYPTSAAQGMRDAMATNQFNQGRTKNNCTTPPCAGSPNPAPLSGWPGATHGYTPLTGGALSSLTGAPSAVNVIPMDIQSPRIDQYNITVEREIGKNMGVRASYLGTQMSGLIAGRDLNALAPNDIPFGTTVYGDGVTPCDPLNNGDCGISAADRARLPFPLLNSYMGSYENFGTGRSHAMQLELNRRYAKGLMFNAVYTLLSQKADGLDTGNSSLGGTLYNQWKPHNDYARDAYISRHRFVAYGTYDLPFGRGRQFGAKMPKWLDHMAGGWQLSSQMFAKSGTGFTPYWQCDNCSGNGVYPGNMATEFTDAVGGFGDSGNSYRPLVVGDWKKGVSGDKIWNTAAFGLPTVGADVLDNPQVAKRNILDGPGTWAANLSVRKNFRVTERLRANLGAVFDNLFNHPLLSPTDYLMAWLGSFSIEVDQKTGKLLPIKVFSPNPDFGRVWQSYRQENIDNRRSVRLMLRFTF